MNPILKSKITTNEELTLFPRYHNPSYDDPILPNTRPRSAVTNNSKINNNRKKQLHPEVNQSQSVSKIRTITSSNGANINNLKTKSSRPQKLQAGPKNGPEEVLLDSMNPTEVHLEIAQNVKVKKKESPKKKFDPSKQIIPPNASAYARYAASTVRKKKAVSPTRNTQVVLAPRFGPDNFFPPKSKLLDKRETPPGRKREIWSRPSSESFTHDNGQDSAFMLRMDDGMFPPEKARWVQLALEKLWRSGTISRRQMNIPAFQRKIGNLFDQSVEKRSMRAGSHVNKLILQGSASAESSMTPGIKSAIPQTPPSPNRSKSRNKEVVSSPKTRKQDTPRTPKPGTPITSPRSALKVSLIEQPEELQRKLSDILLNMLLKGMIADNDIKNVSVDDYLKSALGESRSKSTSPKPVSITQRSMGTNTENDDDIDDWAWMARETKVLSRAATTTKLKRGKTTSSNIAELTASWIQPEKSPDSFQDIKNCFIFEGKVCPMEASKKPTSTFAPFSESRRRCDPLKTGYFRRFADVRGFQPGDITIKYSKSRIFIEAKQAASEDQNYRVIREIIVLPRGVGINQLKVMRARNNGRLLFEEQEYNLLQQF